MLHSFQVDFNYILQDTSANNQSTKPIQHPTHHLLSIIHIRTSCSFPSSLGRLVQRHHPFATLAHLPKHTHNITLSNTSQHRQHVLPTGRALLCLPLLVLSTLGRPVRLIRPARPPYREENDISWIYLCGAFTTKLWRLLCVTTYLLRLWLL